jgi:hypothetical protein
MTAWIIQNCERTFKLKAKVPVFVGGQLDVAVVHKACTVEDDVNAGEAGHLGCNRRLVEHVQHRCVHVGHALIRLEQFGVHIGGVHGGTFCGHGQRGSLANALTGSGDQGDFSFESHGALISR